MADYEKALSLISGGGGGITTYPVVYDSKTYEMYVEVTDSELLEKAKNGLVLFTLAEEISCSTYIVGSVADDGAYTLYPQGASKLFHTWTYSNGKYVLASDDHTRTR